MGKDTSFWLRFQGKKSFFLFLFVFVFWCNVFHPTQVHSQDVYEENETAHISKFKLDYSKPWGEFYIESCASDHDDYNIETSAFVKKGLHLYKLWDNYLDVYLKARLYHDLDGYYWNAVPILKIKLKG